MKEGENNICYVYDLSPCRKAKCMLHATAVKVKVKGKVVPVLHAMRRIGGVEV
jgi:hypothetical protein